MLGKFNYADVKCLKMNTSNKYDGKEINFYPNIKVGYYHPSYANWAYEFYVIDTGKYLMMVVTTFGHIIAKGDF